VRGKKEKERAGRVRGTTDGKKVSQEVEKKDHPKNVYNKVPIRALQKRKEKHTNCNLRRELHRDGAKRSVVPKNKGFC